VAEAFLRRQFGREGRFRAVAGPVYDALVAQELLFERMMDARAPARQDDDRLLSDVTVLVKTFERPRIIARLLASVKRLYPTLEVVVVDDSRNPGSFQGATTVTMPHDSGLSAGRNEGLRHISTDYVLLVDDDVVFTRRTGLGPALALMEQTPEIDIMGGRLIDLPFYRTRSSGDGLDAMPPTDARPAVALGTSIGGLTVCAKVPNFFLARRARLALVPWDARLKLMEHADFFARALGVLVTVFNPDLECLHARTPFDEEYMRRRLDVAAPAAVLAERYERG
jgi:hypothetical protein